MIKEIKTPLNIESVNELKIGDIVLVSGKIYTARDAVHQALYNGKIKLPFSLEGEIIYHCGPIIRKEENKWAVKAAGPTTSTRQEPYMYEIIKRHKIRAIIGKGGMGERTAVACRKFGCCYLHTIGGAAQVLSECITKVNNVYFYDEFGGPEAVWELEVKSFPTVVTIDSRGNNLHNRIKDISQKRLESPG